MKLGTIGKMKISIRTRDYNQLEQAVVQIYFIAKNPRNNVFLHLVGIESLLINLARLDHNPRVVLHALLSLRLISLNPLSALRIITNPNLEKCLKDLVDHEVVYIQEICGSILANIFTEACLLDHTAVYPGATGLLLRLMSESPHGSPLQIKVLSALDEITQNAETAALLCRHGSLSFPAKLISLLFSEFIFSTALTALRVLANLTLAANCSTDVFCQLVPHAEMLAEAAKLLEHRAIMSCAPFGDNSSSSIDEVNATPKIRNNRQVNDQYTRAAAARKCSIEATKPPRCTIQFTRYADCEFLKQLVLECVWFYRSALVPKSNPNHASPSHSFDALSRQKKQASPEIEDPRGESDDDGGPNGGACNHKNNYFSSSAIAAGEY